MNYLNKSDNVHPWDLVWGQPYIESDRLLASIEALVSKQDVLDFRTRLLVRDSVSALQSYLGDEKLKDWLKATPARSRVERILSENLGEPGFRNIRSRLVTNFKMNHFEQLFDWLGGKIQQPVDCYIAGSIPTVLEGLTARPTDDIDFVDEIPAEIRNQQQLLDQVSAKFGLTLSHVQSHYMPTNWRSRVHSLGTFGRLTVYFVDVYDIFVSKLSSKKEKHQDDLRVLAQKLDKSKIRQRLIEDGKPFLENPSERKAIEAQWTFLFREPLSLEDGSQLS